MTVERHPLVKIVNRSKTEMKISQRYNLCSERQFALFFGFMVYKFVEQFLTSDFEVAANEYRKQVNAYLSMFFVRSETYFQ